ncbi:serine/threonine-protein kinase [Nonomuraea typhae]|uniref:serine/threonine-protein kinase n=1 Tax=Nonomuraea typhae TaxID=2603600 RepID=UPI0012F79851|nr:serine/threonine-protein kinase [Nonomuraea typhae]
MPQIAPLVAGDPGQLGSFRLTGRVGEGGQGIVYLGVNEQGERAAIKLLHVKFSGDTIARSRFARELKAAERVASFCTARVMEADLDGNTPYIASEYIDGVPLRDLVDDDGPLRGTALDRLAIGTATALTAIHHASIVHRDFKPDNVLIAADGPRVVDFGIARIVDSTGTITSRAIGTPAYMAPEQIAGDDVGPYTDVFAWGATIAFAATGVTVFEGSSIAVVLNRILNHEVDVSAMPEPLRSVVASALAKDPQARPTADQLLLRLLGQPDTSGASTAVLSRGAEVASDDTTPFTRVRTTLADRKPVTDPAPVPNVTTQPPAVSRGQAQLAELVNGPPPQEQPPPSPPVKPPAPKKRGKGPGRWIAVAVALLLLAAAAVLAVLNDWPWAFGAQPSSGGGNTQPGDFASVIDKVGQTGKLTIGVKGDLPGIGLGRDGSFQGFDVELAQRIARALGAKDVTYAQVGRFDRAASLKSGKVDLVVATYSVDPDEDVLFAGPYYVAHHDVLVRSGANVRTLQDLQGRRLCAPSSPSVANVQDRVKVEPVPADNYAQCMDKIKSGEVDAIPGEDLLLAGFANRETSLRFSVLGAKLNSQRYAVGIKRGDSRTCKAVSGVIAQLYTDGTVAKLLRKHFGNVDFAPELKAPLMEPCE